MSTLHHESLYETCLEEAYEEYMQISGLSSVDLDRFIKINPFVQRWMNDYAQQKFDDMCQ
tara:strand:- start:51 stop:230 length:180 start_codon:yes stop_codon:yes gene_type:complete